MANLDSVDLALLRALVTDPRASIVALAERIGLSRNTVQSRMSRLESSGALLGIERSISIRDLGFPIEALIHVRLRQHETARIRDDLARLPEILQARGLSGPMDMLLQVACRDADHLFDLDARILSIEGVERTETSLVMQDLIPYRAVPLIDLASE